MSKVNFVRVILGGLLSGLVLNIGEFLLNEVIFVKQMEETAARLHIQRPGTTFIAVATMLTFVLGIIIVLVYALIRTRVGPGPKSAILAGLVGWFCVYLYAGTLNGVLFGLAPHLVASASFGDSANTCLPHLPERGSTKKADPVVAITRHHQLFAGYYARWTRSSTRRR